LLVEKVQQLDLAAATHEVAMARDVVSEHLDDGIENFIEAEFS